MSICLDLRAPSSGDSILDLAVRPCRRQPANRSHSASRYTINEKTDDLIKEAQELLTAGKPRQLMLLPTWWYVISTKTFLDRLTKVSNLVENAKRIRCPVLFIRGDHEPVENYPAEKFKENSSGPCEVVIIPNCDHFYVGIEE